MPRQEGITWPAQGVCALCAAVAIASAVCTEAYSAPSTFRANEDERDEVVFVSKAPLEEFTGTAQKVRGEVHIDSVGDVINAPVAALIEVDLDSVDTGIKLRDRHMQQNYLETDRYPKATFLLETVESAYVLTSESDGGSQKLPVTGVEPSVATHLEVKGTFEIHGVRNALSIEHLTVTYVPEANTTDESRPGDNLHIQAIFSIRLEDYDVKRPLFMFMRVAEDVRVEMDIWLGTGVEGV